MNTKTKFALAAVLFSAIASPAFAGDQDLAALQVSSGRILGTQFAMPAGAYASAAVTTAPRAATHWTSDMAINDRLAQGRL
jgi:hypothetical protein